MLSRIVYNEQISQMYGVYGEYESSFDPFPSRLSIYIAQIVPLEIAFSFENYRFNASPSYFTASRTRSITKSRMPLVDYNIAYFATILPKTYAVC